MVDFRVEPGIVTFVISVIMERISVPFMDWILSSAAMKVYYRRIEKGRSILVKSADIPGLTIGLLGDRLERVNLIATALKAALLSLIFVVGILMTSRTDMVLLETRRMSTFKLLPADAAWLRPVVYTVMKGGLFHSAMCYVQQDANISYYAIAFDLENGVQIDNDLGDPNVNMTNQYRMNLSTIICMTPGRVVKPRLLAKVVGCSREKPHGCLDDSFMDKPHNISITADGEEFFGELDLYNFTDYDVKGVTRTWPEFTNPRLTCLTLLAISSTEGERRSRQCLLVDRNGTHTIVELWRVQQNGSGDLVFRLWYPGPVFEGDLAIERYQSALLVRQIRIGGFVNWRDLSGMLVAGSSEFVGSVQVEIGEPKTITELPLWVVILGGSAALFLVIMRAVFLFTSDRDKRPRFNTVNGLSSMLRETHSPSAQSLIQGEESHVGMLPSSADGPRFGAVMEHEAVLNHESKQGRL